MHDNFNGWASAATNGALNYMSYLFNYLETSLGYATPPIEIDGISLPWGGLFDYSVEWSPPHISHRFGNSVDVCMKVAVDCSHGFTAQQRRALSFALFLAGFATP